MRKTVITNITLFLTLLGACPSVAGEISTRKIQQYEDNRELMRILNQQEHDNGFNGIDQDRGTASSGDKNFQYGDLVEILGKISYRWGVVKETVEPEASHIKILYGGAYGLTQMTIPVELLRKPIFPSSATFDLTLWDKNLSVTELNDPKIDEAFKANFLATINESINRYFGDQQTIHLNSMLIMFLGEAHAVCRRTLSTQLNNRRKLVIACQQFNRLIRKHVSHQTQILLQDIDTARSATRPSKFHPTPISYGRLAEDKTNEMHLSADEALSTLETIHQFTQRYCASLPIIVGHADENLDVLQPFCNLTLTDMQQQIDLFHNQSVHSHQSEEIGNIPIQQLIPLLLIVLSIAISCAC